MSLMVQRQWSDIRPGDYVQDKAGLIWKVEKRGMLGEIHLVNEHGHRVDIGRQSGPVMLWDGSPEAENLEAFRVALGGHIVYDRH